jgi:hypothetical protein
VASHANHFPKLDEEKERQMTATSGRTCLPLLHARFPDGSLLKTCVASLLGTTEWFSKSVALTWKASVTKSNRLLFQLVPSTRHTDVTGCGLLATPNTMDSMAPKTERAVLREATETRKGLTNFANLRDQLWHGKLLPTPATRDWKGGSLAKGKDTVDSVIETGARKGQIGHKTGLRLQPAFALWMMGYPTDWCDLADGEMPPSKRREMQ